MFTKKLLAPVLAFAGLTLGGLGASAQEATYNVPTDDPDLEPHATMALDRVEGRLRDGGKVRVKYRLPPELGGQNGLQLDLRGRMPLGIGEATLVGVSTTPGCVPTDTDDDSCTVTSTAECKRTENDSLSCKVDYENLKIDATGAESFMRAQGFSAAKIESMLAVGATLQHQAQGIVTIPKHLFRQD